MSEHDHYKRLTISLPQDLFETFEEFRESLGMSRSDAIRKAMVKFIVTPADMEDKNEKFRNKNVTGIVSYVESSHVHAHPSDPTFAHEHKSEHVHNHKEHVPEVHTHSHNDEKGYYQKVEKIEYIRANEIQHEFLDVIRSSLHIHLGPESCMEIIACIGTYERVEEFYNKIRTLKTLKNCELVIMDIIE